MTAEGIAGYSGITEHEYRRRIRAWELYDWANSAFATTILAAVLPVYYSQVAGRTLASSAQATQFWTTTLSVSLIIVAVLAPILGTISDIKRGKKRFLAVSILVGSLGTALLAFVGTGDWLLASVLFVIGRLGFAAGNVFYDSLLPHVARDEDQDRVSTMGYALGYLGGGLLLALNIAMIFVLGQGAGTRLAFVSVAVWWLIFSIPILRRVPEPPAAVGATEGGMLSVTFRRLGDTFSHLRRYRELLKFLISFLIYNDGIGTIITVAAIYGAELGFGAVDLIAAILLVQFVGIPFSIAFGRIPSRDESRRAFFLAFVLWNLVALPLVGVGGSRILDQDVTGTPPPEYSDVDGAVGEGDYPVDADAVSLVGAWTVEDDYARTETVGDSYELRHNGTTVRLEVEEGPDRSRWMVFINGEPVEIDDDEKFIDGYNPALHAGVEVESSADAAGEHVLSIVNSDETHESAEGTVMAIGEAEVLPPPRTSNLGMILGLLLVVEVVGLVLAAVFGKALFSGLADRMTTKRTIVLPSSSMWRSRCGASSSTA